MVKFLSIAVSALLSFASIKATPQVNDPLPCLPLDLQKKSLDFMTINQLVKVAISSGLLSGGLKKVDPLSISNKPLEKIPFSVLGNNFTVKPFIKEINVTGLSTVIPRSITVQDAQNLSVGVDFNGNVTVSSTLSFEIEQLNKKWWQICWTSILHPSACPPEIVDVEVGIAVEKPSVGANMSLSMVQCDPVAVQQGKCKDLSVNDIITAALSQQFAVVLVRLLRRIHALSIEDILLSFNQINELRFHFPTSGQLITALGKKLLGFTTKEINEKKHLYKKIIEVGDNLIKSFGNQVIQEKLQPLFGNNCYDA